MNAPLALFVYNRVDHTRQVLESLKTNLLSDETDLFIFSDAPRKGSEDKVKEVRKLIREKQWCKNVHITENTANKGVDDNIVENVTELINRFGKVIIIEDDCVLSKYFLKYMNNALDFYANEERVMHISAYCHPSEVILPSTYFSQDSNGWGWATWKRAWQHYEKDPVKLYNILEKENLLKQKEIKLIRIRENEFPDSIINIINE